MTALDLLLDGRTPKPFGHRQHLEAAVQAVDRFGVAAGELVIRGVLKATAARDGAPDKYHDTVTRFWVQLVAHTMRTTGSDDLDSLIDACPPLIQKESLAAHWSRQALGSTEARSGWRDPDLEPLPWQEAAAVT